tara:strand:- start:81 stop:1385 length:1305 start_codon:yes stop_codon:yes gene_type:complete
MAQFNETVCLHKALDEFQNAKEVDDIDESIGVKSAGKTVVKYIVKSTDRETTRTRVEASLKKYKVGRVGRKQISDSSMQVTECIGKEGKYTFVYKPLKGGMSQTTLNASITELFPCIAWETGIQGTRSDRQAIRGFYDKIIQNNNLKLKCYLSSQDAAAGHDFVQKAELGKFEEKVKNAINILRWIRRVESKHPISQIYWGYRKKPAGVMSNHPGDIFLKFTNGNLLGVSLKAGGAKTDEPKLNTYVKPIYDFYGKSAEYNKLKDKLWPQYEQIPGIDEDDKKYWGKNNLALKTYAFEKQDSKSYNELYDINLGIIRGELIKLISNPSNFTKTKQWLSEKVAQQQQDVPLVVVKATEAFAKRDKGSDILIEAVAAVKKIEATASTSSKQAFHIKLTDGSKVMMDFSTRTNKVGANHKLGQFSNLAVKFNKVKPV